MPSALNRIGLCGLAILPLTVYATSTLGFCKKDGQVKEPKWFENPDCKAVVNWADAVCYATPAEFSKKGGDFKVTEGPELETIKCRVFKDDRCKTTSGNGDLVAVNTITDDLLSFACFGPATQKLEVLLLGDKAKVLPDLPATKKLSDQSAAGNSNTTVRATPLTGGSSASKFTTISASASGKSVVPNGNASSVAFSAITDVASTDTAKNTGRR